MFNFWGRGKRRQAQWAHGAGTPAHQRAACVLLVAVVARSRCLSACAHLGKSGDAIATLMGAGLNPAQPASARCMVGSMCARNVRRDAVEVMWGGHAGGWRCGEGSWALLSFSTQDNDVQTVTRVSHMAQGAPGGVWARGCVFHCHTIFITTPVSAAHIPQHPRAHARAPAQICCWPSTAAAAATPPPHHPLRSPAAMGLVGSGSIHMSGRFARVSVRSQQSLTRSQHLLLLHGDTR